ncbi:hypothetical protein [Sphingomonas solaris]|uniref:Uncharacterized protein n=1 Tax=Alterirhizorhabdus solaris TaxID=2529389 RepID=A0A558RDQ6_9SPHN|nr:hypothetical protein [Sphingomonas solaris]TVV77322.1 hypothetical protein FOY91_00705 [Sphingomonas solaris]
MERPPHILNASSNLLGIALLIITGLNISKTAGGTMADEVAWVACLMFGASCLLSYLAIRSPEGGRAEVLADRIFLAGLVALLGSVVVLALNPPV